jgi:hypothetical protein
MVTTSNTPSEAERRAEDCLAKAAYCKWVVSVTTDQQMRDYYVKLSIACLLLHAARPRGCSRRSASAEIKRLTNEATDRSSRSASRATNSRSCVGNGTVKRSSMRKLSNFSAASPARKGSSTH